MRYHRNPQARLSKQATSDNFNPGDAWKGRRVHPVAEESCGASGGASEAAAHAFTITKEETRCRCPRRLDPRALVAPVPSVRSTFALDVAPDAVPEHVAATAVQAAIVADARRGTP